MFLFAAQNNHICYFPLRITNEENEYKELLKNKINEKESDQELIPEQEWWSNIIRNNCINDVKGNKIEMINMNSNVERADGARRFLLYGNNFLCEISYMPVSYDWNRIMFTVTLIKLIHHNVNNNERQTDTDQQSVLSNRNGNDDFEREYLLINNVQTFLVLDRTMEVMVFFATNKFCIINYYNQKVLPFFLLSQSNYDHFFMINSSFSLI